jgi:hypothetical protein
LPEAYERFLEVDLFPNTEKIKVSTIGIELATHGFKNPPF